MSYKIIIDSCGELTEKMKKDGHFASAALTLYVDEHTIVDDETFRQSEFLKMVAESPKKAYVFNSRSASIGETLIGMKIQECEEAGMSFEEVVVHVEAYIAKQKTWFVLESLESLRKNGRLSHMKAILATALKIKPVMTSTPEGTIEQLAQARGINKALVKMADSIVEYVGHDEDRILAISHCNCPQRAEMLKEELSKRMKLRDIIVEDTAGVSSLYANDGGIIVVV